MGFSLIFRLGQILLLFERVVVIFHNIQAFDATSRITEDEKGISFMD
jgi:hypothetical protein